MKTIITFFAFSFFANVVSAQNPSVQTYFDDAEPWMYQIYNYPGDPTSLLAVHREFNGTNFVYELAIPDVGTYNAVIISGCTEVTSSLNEVPGGAVLSGDFVGQGNELMFFDGLNPVVFDLNPGSGDSDPEIFPLNDGLFITAFDGNARQLYHFVSSSEVKKITTESNDVFLPVGKKNNDYLYQMTQETSSTEVQWKLKCARDNGGLFAYTTVRTATFPIVSGNPSATPDGLVWLNGLNSNGQFILIEDITNFQASSKDFFVLNYDESAQQVSVVDQLSGFGNSGFSSAFEFENDICWYVTGMTGIRRSSDGVNFAADVNSETGANEQILMSYVSEDGVLWTVRSAFPGNPENLIAYSNGQLTPTISGNHFHFSLENQGKLFLTDFSIFYDAHYVHELELATGNVESYFIDSSDFHSPTEHASVMLNGTFTFLYDRSNPQWSTDILQINSGNAGLSDNVEEDLIIYPNPSNGNFTIEHTLQQPTLRIYNLLGELVFEEIETTNNHFSISNLNSGVYLIELSNQEESVRSKIRFY